MGHPSSGKSILIMDDDPIFRQLIRSILEKDGFQIREAGTGAEAWAALEEEVPDLVVVDGELPDTDGIFWIGECRKRNYGMAVVFASSLWREKQVHQYLKKELGVALVLHKPIDTSRFGPQIMKVLDISPEEKPKDGFAEKLKQLHRQFAASLLEELALLNQELLEARQGFGSEEALLPLIARSHRLRGSSPSFGFGKVGAEMGRIEDHCRECQEAGSEPQWSLLTQAVQRSGELAGAETTPEPEPKPAENVSRPVAMVIEDDPGFLDKMTRIGETHNLLILKVDTADQAIDIARRNHPDLIVANMKLCLNPDGSNLMQKLHNLLGGDNYAVVRIWEGAEQPDRGHFHGTVLNKSLDEKRLGEILVEQIKVSQQSREHILIVDDDTHFLELASETLISHGFTTTVSHKPSELTTLLEEHEPDLILLDVEMPEISGFQLCDQLRGMSKWQSIPILFLSVRNDPESRVTAFHKGADDYVTKPIVGKELVARIEVRLERGRFLGRYREAVYQAEQAEKNMLAVFHKLDLGVVVIDHDGKVALINEAGRSIFDVKLSQVLGKNWECLGMDPQYLSELKTMVARPVALRSKMPLRQGAFHLELDIQDDPRNPNGRILYFKDVSELHRLRQLARD